MCVITGSESAITEDPYVIKGVFKIAEETSGNNSFGVSVAKMAARRDDIIDDKDTSSINNNLDLVYNNIDVESLRDTEES